MATCNGFRTGKSPAGPLQNFGFFIRESDFLALIARNSMRVRRCQLAMHASDEWRRLQ